MAWFDCGLTFTHFYLVTSNLLPNFLIAVTHSVFNIMSSVIALNQIDGSELWKKVGFKHSEKVLVALRGVYNLPFNLDDPVYLYLYQLSFKCRQCVVFVEGLNACKPKFSLTCHPQQRCHTHNDSAVQC